MKQDKALLPVGGVSLLQCQFKKLVALLGEDHVIVSGDRPEYPHVKDIEPNLGPIEGLRSVLRILLKNRRNYSLLVVPVDMPFLTEDILSKLLQAKCERPITKFKGQQLPFVIKDLSTVLKFIEKIKATEEIGHRNSFKNLFNKLEVNEIGPEPEMFFANLNTPEDWNAAIY
jgi:molybdopterin-guanine dinucleotide biosynthesis protein A